MQGGLTAKAAIKSMYQYTPSSIYDKLPKSIYLLQSTLPDSMKEYRNNFAEKFSKCTDSKLKRIEEAGHLIHWDKPNEVVKEIVYLFK